MFAKKLPPYLEKACEAGAAAARSPGIDYGQVHALARQMADDIVRQRDALAEHERQELERRARERREQALQYALAAQRPHQDALSLIQAAEDIERFLAGEPRA